MSEPSEKTPARETKGWWNKLCIIPGRLENKIAIVTGANAGIGFYTASELARRGCIVIMACRNQERAEAARQSMLDKYGGQEQSDVAGDEVKASLSPIRPEQLIINHLDLSSSNSIRDFVRQFTATYSRLDFLINNAGLVSNKYAQTEDGFEMTLGTNHLGPFLLTELLLPLLKQSAPARIIMVSSKLHMLGNLNRPDFQLTQANYNMYKAYAQSKLANAIYVKELSKRLEGSSLTVASLHPGVVKTELSRDPGSGFHKVMASMVRTFSIDAWTGAQTTLYTVLTPNLESGGYYSNCALTRPAQAVLDENNQKWLREKSSELVGLSVEHN